MAAFTRGSVNTVQIDAADRQAIGAAVPPGAAAGERRASAAFALLDTER